MVNLQAHIRHQIFSILIVFILSHVEVGFPSSDIQVGSHFSHIALSCDDLTLAIAFERDGNSLLGFIDVRAFFSNVSCLLLL